MDIESIKNLASAFKEKMTSLDKNISLKDFRNFLNNTFADKKPHERLVVAMFERFKPFRLEGDREKINAASETSMYFLDFILAMNLLARIVQPAKLKLLFELCDDDEDGCMMPDDILYMLQRVERIFAQECARVDLESNILNNMVADKKAELNFHRIIGII